MAFFNRFGGRNLSGKGITNIPTYKLNITSDVERYNARTNAISAGWDGTSRCNIIIEISPGVTVYSTDYLNSALNIELNAGFIIPGTTVKLINKGKIIGAGGKGVSGCFTNYKSQHVNTDHPAFNGEVLGNQDSAGLWWYMHGGSEDPLYFKGGDAVYCDQDIIIDTAYSGAVIGGGGGGGAAGRMGLYGDGVAGASAAKIAKSKAGFEWYQTYGYAAGGAGGGGQGAGTCAAGAAGSYDAWFTHNGFSATKGQAACQGNAGTAGSLVAAGTGGVGKDSGEGTGKIFDGGGNGGTLGAIGGNPVWGNHTYGYVYYGYENCGPSTQGSQFATQSAGATGYPAGAYNPDNLYGGSITPGVRRGAGGYSIRKPAARRVTYVGAYIGYLYGTVGS